MVTIKHFSHNHHPLVLKEKEEDEDEENYCYGCRNRIRGPSYECKECKLLLHKSCAEAPRKLKHPLHTSHELFLLTRPPDVRCNCNGCQQEWSNFTYTCDRCKFHLDITCATLPKTIQGDHTHVLTLIPRIACIVCDGCGLKHEGMSYQCSTCHFWVHRDCVSFPRWISVDEHRHVLVRYYSSLKKDTNSYKRCCVVCKCDLPKTCFYYSCVKCQCYVHLGCATKRIRDQEKDQRSKIYTGDQITTVKLPFHDDSIDISTRLRDEIDHSKNAVIVSKKLKHFSHNHYLLHYVSQFAIEKCDACAKPISSTHYGCKKCRFFLHKQCAELPSTIEHPVDPFHVLKLVKDEPKYFKCSFCKEVYHGFFYNCREPIQKDDEGRKGKKGELTLCPIKICVYCTSLPRMIQHEVHQHKLILSQKSSDNCFACDDGDLPLYKCMTCKFALHIWCALLPYLVAHKHETKPLTLIYGGSNNNGDSEGYCDICEDAINLVRDFYYYNEEREFYAHTRCIYKKREYSNVIGRKLMLSSHIHELIVLVQDKVDRVKCDNCGKDITRGSVIFSCTKCSAYNLDAHCAITKYIIY